MIRRFYSWLLSLFRRDQNTSEFIGELPSDWERPFAAKYKRADH